MSTKNLAPTVIEGGRAFRNQWERRQSNATARVHTRVFTQRLCTCDELDALVYPMRKKVYREFNDKLNPAERWLERQVGRPWNEVRSELTRAPVEGK
jgi:hypothetical protein